MSRFKMFLRELRVKRETFFLKISVRFSRVERLHRCLNDALHESTTAATWTKEIPLELLGLRAQPRKDIGLSLAEAVFGARIVLPNDFLSGDEIPVDTISKKKKISGACAFSLPRHNLSHQLLSKLLADLLSAPLVWARRCSVVLPL